MFSKNRNILYHILQISHIFEPNLKVDNDQINMLKNLTHYSNQIDKLKIKSDSL